MLEDKDRIFTNLYGMHDRSLAGARARGHWDGTAGLIAKRLGVKVARYVAATNVNDVVPEYLRSGVYEPRASVRTVANAMDVGAPSNFERVQSIYGADLPALRPEIAAGDMVRHDLNRSR